MGETRLYQDRDFEAFILDDGTGSAYVDPSDADFLLSEDDEISVDEGEEPPPHVAEFLTSETSIDIVGEYERLYNESRLEVDGTVRVAGQADPEATSAVKQDPTTAVVSAGDAPKFLVSDDPDIGLGRRLYHEAGLYFLIAAICLGVAYFLIVGF